MKDQQVTLSTSLSSVHNTPAVHILYCTLNLKALSEKETVTHTCCFLQPQGLYSTTHKQSQLGTHHCMLAQTKLSQCTAIPASAALSFLSQGFACEYGLHLILGQK